MKMLIYSKDNCTYCTQAKNLADREGIEYIETKLGQDMAVEDFKALFPDQKTVPLIIIDEVKIGGYNEFSKWIQSRRAT